MHHEKEEIIVIGDSLTSDIFGAYNYGLKSIWFNKKNIEEKEALYTYKVLGLNEIKKYL
jgi:ribonucleotide monophosphatase NagD (HAD superfamily)